MEFDLTLVDYGTPGTSCISLQNGVACIMQRVRFLYGASPLEDVIGYNMINRCLIEWTGTNQSGTLDQTTINEGVGGAIMANDSLAIGSTVTGIMKWGMVNVRQKYIQGIDHSSGGTSNFNSGAAFGYVPNKSSGSSGAVNGTATTRRYQIPFLLGLMTQDKLLPTKFMASQLAIEISLENAANCIIAAPVGSGTDPTYIITNVNLIPEILEFDASYDALFLKGLQEGGVPIKFSSWHTYTFGTSAGTNFNLQIQERSRSVKALFCVQRRATAAFDRDSHATHFATVSGDLNTTPVTLQSYQFRIGGRYYPGQPVQCSTQIGSDTTNGGCEAYIELQKALNMVGDYRLSTSVNTARWAVMPGYIAGPSGTSAVVATDPATLTAQAAIYSEYDYRDAVLGYWSDGRPIYSSIISGTNSFCSNVGSACFTAAIDLETSNGIEISGLNAEEQSDISLIMNFSKAQSNSFVFDVYSYYDAMIILRENNVLELIQ